MASLLPELVGRRVPPQWEEIVHQLDWQRAEILGNWDELVLLMGIVAAAAYRIGLRLGRDGQKTSLADDGTS